MSLLIRVPLDLLLWLVFIACDVLLWLIGFPVVYFLARAGAHELVDSPFFTPRHVLMWKSKLARLWGNWEDGIDGAHEQNWIAKDIQPLWKCIFLWSAWRNPVGNLRFVPGIHPKPDPKRIRYVGNSLDPAVDLDMRRTEGIERRTPLWCYASQGLFAGFWIIWPFSSTRHFRLRVGWKILGKDAVRGIVDDYRQFFYPFALQFTPWRKG